MRKGLFPAVLIGLLGSGIAYAGQEHPWGYLPPNINSAYGETVDSLYLQIMVVVAIVFILTEGALLVFCFWYRRRAGQKARYLHGSQKAEIIWTVIPGLILLWLALAQSGTWAKIKRDFPPEKDAVVIEVFPRQFEWHFRYPGSDGQFGTDDDVVTVNLLHVPVNKKIIVKLTAKDVIHSFYLPHARVKQDAVPGVLTRAWFELDKIPCWNLKEQKLEFLNETDFNAKKVALDGFALKVEVLNKTGQKKYEYEPYSADRKPKEGSLHYKSQIQRLPINQVEKEAEYVLHTSEVACAELCGAIHFRMRAVLIVETDAMFQEWLKKKGKSVLPYDEWQDDREYKDWKNIWDKHHKNFNDVLSRANQELLPLWVF